MKNIFENRSRGHRVAVGDDALHLSLLLIVKPSLFKSVTLILRRYTEILTRQVDEICVSQSIYLNAILRSTAELHR